MQELSGDQELGNKVSFGKHSRLYDPKSDLKPAERILIDLFADKWASFDMLDLGVGTGRTTNYFASLVRSYVGVDYSESMVEECRRNFPNYPIRCMDASELTAFFGEKQFDFIMFSFNGIDYVNFGQRRKILREIYAHLRPSGHFFFSTHSLDPYPTTVPYTYRRDGAHRGELWTFYGKSAYQVQELFELKFLVERRFDNNGVELKPLETTKEYCTNYLCRKM